ncbi:MAG: hypothetical protein GX445_02155 [Elusimicrobia bacterium]|jgi:pyruvoyl-dependent arginine decarboxylase (PvlArgDC)|nr:hypothetical protein [Elusimicrobiota bacterium]
MDSFVAKKIFLTKGVGRHKEKQWEMSGKIVKTMNMTKSAIGKEGIWTTVVAAAVFAE